jgi:hypothetical protein
MKIADLSPMVTPWKHGQKLTASSWVSHDVTDDDGFAVRVVWHYSTLMVEFVDMGDGSWWAGAVSVGHGSVSDQNGVNTLFQSVGSDLRYRRDAKGGGPRIVNGVYGNLVATADGSGPVL